MRRPALRPPSQGIRLTFHPQGDLNVGIYSKAAMHTPLEVTLDALAQAKALDADCCVRPAALLSACRADVLHPSLNRSL